MTPDTESPYCAEIPGTYTIAIVDSGDLTVVVVDDGCDPRRSDIQNGLVPQADTGS